MFDKKIFIAVACFFVMEALLSLWTGQPYDMKVWFNTGAWMTQGINIYAPPNHLGYPPLWAFWCAIAYNLSGFVGRNMELWRLLIKLPLIASHLALAFMVGKYAESRFESTTARKIFWIILSWSFFIYIGAIWGQINTLSALLTFLAFYAVTSKKNIAGAVLLGLAVALKTYPIVTLPAFFIFLLKNQGKKEAGKFGIVACGVPVLFILTVFAVFQWDIMYFLKTVFYGIPVFESGAPLFVIGAMNFWSFLALQGIDIVPLWHIRLLWIPLLAVCAIFWMRKPKFVEKDLVLSIISFYILFMFYYGWISEQTFIDPLPFFFLAILAFEPKKIYFYALLAIQGFVYIFTVANQTLFVFTPLLERFLPPLLTGLTNFHLENGPLVHTIRGTMGLVISLSLLIFLLLLIKPEILGRAEEEFQSAFRLIIRRMKAAIKK